MKQSSDTTSAWPKSVRFGAPTAKFSGDINNNIDINAAGRGFVLRYVVDSEGNSDTFLFRWKKYAEEKEYFRRTIDRNISFIYISSQNRRNPFLPYLLIAMGKTFVSRP